MLVAHNLICIVIPYVSTLHTLILVDLSDSALAFRWVTKQCLTLAALLTRDHKIPLEGMALGQQHGGITGANLFREMKGQYCSL